MRYPSSVVGRPSRSERRKGIRFAVEGLYNPSSLNKVLNGLNLAIEGKVVEKPDHDILNEFGIPPK
jgi:hypothetical protein